MVDDSGPPAILDSSSGVVLRRYSEFTGSVPPLQTSSASAIVDAVAAILKVEGPATGYRIERVYMAASGGRRATREITKILKRAIGQGVRNGVLLTADPFESRWGEAQYVLASGNGGREPQTARSAED